MRGKAREMGGVRDWHDGKERNWLFETGQGLSTIPL